MTSKYGFSVVAPIRVTSPSSTAGNSASCWALLKRWISSRKKIVLAPVVFRRSRARSITALTSALPACTALCSSNAAPDASAISRASVVLPLPGGPCRIIECGWPSSTARRSAEPGASSRSWPTNSASEVGRMRVASGASAGAAACVPAAGPGSPNSRSVMGGSMKAVRPFEKEGWAAPQKRGASPTAYLLFLGPEDTVSVISCWYGYVPAPPRTPIVRPLRIPQCLRAINCRGAQIPTISSTASCNSPFVASPLRRRHGARRGGR